MYKPLLTGLSAMAMITALAACGDDDVEVEEPIAMEERDDVALPDATDTPPDRMAVDDSMLGDADAELDDVTQNGMDDRTVLEIAMEDGRFSTLTAALEEADLVDALSGAGPYTVFAPTDAAFEDLPAGTVDSLMQPENREQLQTILRYHVISGMTTSDDIAGEMTVDTLAGQDLDVMLSGDQVVVGGEGAEGAIVTTPDLTASNGVIHVIDKVLLPPEAM